jgi:hypothetical protein
MRLSDVLRWAVRFVVGAALLGAWLWIVAGAAPAGAGAW